MKHWETLETPLQVSLHLNDDVRNHLVHSNEYAMQIFQFFVQLKYIVAKLPDHSLKELYQNRRGIVNDTVRCLEVLNNLSVTVVDSLGAGSDQI